MKLLVKFVSFFTLLGLSITTYAAPLFYGQGYGFVVSDPAAFVSAMDKYRASEAGQQSPAMPVLVQNMVNGDYTSTHQVSVFYPSTDAIDQSFAINARSKDWAVFQKSIRRIATPEWENMFAILMAKVKKDPSKMTNPVSIVYSMTVKDPAEYVAAFGKLLESNEIKAFPGNIYLGQSIASGNVKGTHFVTFVAESTGALVSSVMAVQTSAAMADYLSAVGDIRTLEATNMFREVKRWAPDTN
ncbi:hypothetical protein N9W97_02285 [Pseudomonadales bacterium]|jgi:hypothetical protein|nr:hypothetical protein [Pseudomonadales bacterium]